MSSSLVLHHAPRSRSIRVLWLMEEMGLDYRLAPVAFDARPVGDEHYEKVHPLRKVPALEDGDRTMFESIAILQYLMSRYGPTDLDVRPDEPDYARYLQWLHFGEAGMLMPVQMLLAHTTLLPEDKRNPQLAAWGRAEVDKLLAMLGSHAVAGRDYVAADRFTAADISLGYMLYLLKLIRQFDGAPEPVSAYFARLAERPAWAKASGLTEPAA